MKIKNMIVAAYAIICALFSAIFYVLFKQKKDETQALQEQLDAEHAAKEDTEEKLKAETAYAEQLQETTKLYNEGLKVEESTINDLKSDDASVAIAASNKLLDDIRNRGKNRNQD